MRNKGLVLAGFLLFALAFPVERALSQAVYGSIFGTVLDSSGAAVPNAKISITNVNQGVSFNTTSNAAGNYEQTHLIAGTYSVKVEAPGFKPFVQENVVVATDVAAKVDATLSVGAVSQVVTVTAEVPQLKTSRADVSTEFNTRRLEQLPIFERNFTQFELLTPGSSRQPWQHAASENPQGSQQIQINGLPFHGVGYQLDGTDNRDPILGIIVINPNTDAITEAKITTADYDAEFGQATAAVVTAQTKSGTNDLHGSAYWFRRDQNTSARDPFSQARPLRPGSDRFIPDTLWQQIGVTAGAPIMKDKWFIFGDYQAGRQSNGGSLLSRTPTAAERNGDLRGLTTDIFDPCTTRTGTFVPACNVAPANRAQFTAEAGRPDGIAAGTPNVVPIARLSQQTLKLLNSIPLPNQPGATGSAPNFTGSGVETFNSNTWDVRTDLYLLASRMHMFGRYSWQKFLKQDPGLFGNEVGGPAFPGFQFAGQSNVLDMSVAYGVDYSLRPNLQADFRFGFFRYRVLVSPNGLGTTPAKDAGIPNLNNDLTTSGFPAFFINGRGGFNFGYALGVNQCNCPLNEQENQSQWVSNWTYIRGNHTYKFGADIRYAQNLRVPSDTHRAGELSFNSERTEGPTGGVDPKTGLPVIGGGLGLAAFLTGDVSSFGRFVSSSQDAAERQYRTFFYGQDTWRVNPKLTVNMGLRWEIYFPESVNRAGNGANIDPDTGEVEVFGTPGISRTGNIGNTLGNWAPRAAIAYQYNNKTVIRVGYGRSFDVGVFGTLFGHAVTQNIPVLAQQRLDPSNAFDDVFTLAQGPPSVDPAAVLQQQVKAGNVGITGRPILPPNITSFVRPLRERVPTVDQWNFTVQRQLSAASNVEVTYVGNKATHTGAGQAPDYNFNGPTIVGFGTLSTDQRKPFFSKFGWNQSFRYFGNDADSNYNAVQVKYEKRISQGFSILSHYTYSSAFIHDQGYYNINRKIGYGRDPSNHTNLWVFAPIWELPFGKGQKFMAHPGRAMNLLVGGWQINGVVTWASGRPFTLSYKDCGADQDVGVCRPDIVGPITVSRGGNQFGDFTTTKGVELTSNGQTIGPFRRPLAGTFGSATFDGLKGPSEFVADVSFFKDFDITERVKGQFRAESFNFGNNVNLGQPESCVDCDTAGRIFGLADGFFMRRWQFALKLTF